MEVAGVMYRQQVRSIRPDVKAAELKDRSGLPIVRQEVVLRLRVLPWFSVSFFFSISVVAPIIAGISRESVSGLSILFPQGQKKKKRKKENSLLCSVVVMCAGPG